MGLSIVAGFGAPTPHNHPGTGFAELPGRQKFVLLVPVPESLLTRKLSPPVSFRNMVQLVNPIKVTPAFLGNRSSLVFSPIHKRSLVVNPGWAMVSARPVMGEAGSSTVSSVTLERKPTRKSFQPGALKGKMKKGRKLRITTLSVPPLLITVAGAGIVYGKVGGSDTVR